METSPPPRGDAVRIGTGTSPFGVTDSMTGFEPVSVGSNPAGDAMDVLEIVGSACALIVIGWALFVLFRDCDNCKGP